MHQPSAQHSPRTDIRTRDVVNQAIAAIPTLGLQQVAEYLNAMNVPPEVASNSSTSMAQPFGPHHSSSASRSVHAFHTTSRDALKVRVTVNS